MKVRTLRSTRLLPQIRGFFRRNYASLFPPYTRRSLMLRRRLIVPFKRVFGSERSGPFQPKNPDSSSSRGRILWVLHDNPGGVGHASRDLAGALAARWTCWILFADPHRLRLEQFFGVRNSRTVRTWWLREPWTADVFSSTEHKEIYNEVLGLTAPDLVHVRHFLGNTLDLARSCAERNLPAVLSLHDYYLVCPSINLIDDQLRYCGGICTPSTGRCLTPLNWLGNLTMLKGDFLSRWRDAISSTFSVWNAIITTSSSVRDLFLKIYPQLHPRNIYLIEHGRDLERCKSIAVEPTPGGPIKILVLGHIGLHKGSHFIKSLSDLDSQRENRLRFDFLGSIDRHLEGVGRYHGPYQRDQLQKKCSCLRPSFAGIFSICPETHSHVLTEAWALGLPVLATNLGAPADRINSTGGGWTITTNDVGSAYNQILAAADDSKAYRRQKRIAETTTAFTLLEMTKQYERIYLHLVGEKEKIL